MQSKFDAGKSKTAASLAVAHKFDTSKGSGKFDTEKSKKPKSKILKFNPHKASQSPAVSRSDDRVQDRKIRKSSPR